MYIFYTIINDLIHKHVKNAKIYYVIIIFMYVSLHNRRCLVAEWQKVAMTIECGRLEGAFLVAII
jgi:hypothetical protein